MPNHFFTMSVEAEDSVETMQRTQPLFRQLDPDEAELETTQIESFCVSCHQNGVTKLLLTNIPHYNEVVVMSFYCGECGYSNNELQSASEVQKKGIRFELQVTHPSDLNRQVVKSDYTSVRIPHLDFEIPCRSQKGEVTTVEGVIERAAEDLRQDQARRRDEHPLIAGLIDDFIHQLQQLKHSKQPFLMIIDDISGNSWVENPRAPGEDPCCKTSQFVRNQRDDHIIGIYTDEEVTGEESCSPQRSCLPTPTSDGIMDRMQVDDCNNNNLVGGDEILEFCTNCSSCGSPCYTNVKIKDIPFFKEVVIMATNCDACGHRTNEVKSGGGIEDQGIRIVVHVKTMQDLSRDILKSGTCYIKVPEIGLDVGPATLGGMFSTVEGFLTSVRDQLFTQSIIPSDSQPGRQAVFQRLLDKLNSLISGEMPFTLLLDDPAGNSFVQSLSSPEPDERLKVERYTRTHDQNEDLGLNDILTEDYSDDTPTT